MTVICTHTHIHTRTKRAQESPGPITTIQMEIFRKTGLGSMIYPNK